MHIYWRDAIRRAVRTFLQAFLGVFLSLLVTSNVTSQVPEYNALKAAALAAVWAGVIAVLSWLQNALEDNTSVPTLLKPSPPVGNNPALEASVSATGGVTG